METQYSFYPIYIKFLDQNKNLISTLTNNVTTVQDNAYNIPNGTAWILYQADPNPSYYQYGKIYEIAPANEPTFRQQMDICYCMQIQQKQ